MGVKLDGAAKLGGGGVQIAQLPFGQAELEVHFGGRL